MPIQVATEARSADFSSLVKENKWFVDKSLVIKDFLNDNSSIKIITAPRKFGKSIVIDMIRRFVEIEADSSGQQISLTQNENYDLFCNPPLKICQDSYFVFKHLGQHPIIYLTYKPLKAIKNYKNMMRKFRMIVVETFLKHQYLAENPKLFPTALDVKFFHDYFKKPVKKLSRDIVAGSLKWLSKLLYLHFGKKVIVLIDDYDRVHRSLLLTEVHQLDEVMGFLDEVRDRLLKNNRYLDRALLTGILRIQVEGTAKNHFQEYRFLGDHIYSQYFGFTDSEIDELVLKSESNSSEAIDVKELLGQMYSGYSIENQNITIYSTWSVVQCFSNGNTFNSFWVDKHRLLHLLHIFPSDVKLDAIKNLIFGNTYTYGNISSFATKNTIIALKSTNTKIKLESNIKDEESWLYSYLYDMGYLTTTCAVKHEKNLVPLQIPNEEVFLDFCSSLSFLYNQGGCIHTKDDLKRLNDLLDLKLSEFKSESLPLLP